MHECLLCNKNMKKSNNIFGSGCINNIYTFMNLKRVKGKSKEQYLMKI